MLCSVSDAQWAWQVSDALYICIARGETVITKVVTDCFECPNIQYPLVQYIIGRPGYLAATSEGPAGAWTEFYALLINAEVGSPCSNP